MCMFSGIIIWYLTTIGVLFSKEDDFSHSQHPLAVILCVRLRTLGFAPVHFGMSIVIVLAKHMCRQ